MKKNSECDEALITLKRLAKQEEIMSSGANRKERRDEIDLYGYKFTKKDLKKKKEQAKKNRKAAKKLKIKLKK